MAIENSIIDRFTALKKRRDEKKDSFIRLESQLESAKERYIAIMAELKKYEIGSIDELKVKILELKGIILTSLDSTENALNKIDEAEREINNQETSSAVQK